MKKLLLYSALFFAALFTDAQHLFFNTPFSIPLQDINGLYLQNAWVGGINYPLWSTVDLNGDGIKDLYLYDKTNDRVSTFLNDGTPGSSAYHYAPEYLHCFPKVLPDSWAMLYDYNCDGKEDFLALDSLHNGIEVWRNDYTTQTGLKFTKVSGELLESWSGPTPINVYASSIYIPSFSDVDNDGDMDIICFNNPANGKFAYHKNLSMETYGNCDSLIFVFDDKCWGNFTLGLGSNSVSSYHNAPCLPPAVINNGGGGFETSKRDDTITTVCIFDVDGDGVKELLIGDQASPNSLMVHNAGTAQSAEMDYSDPNYPTYDVPVDIFDYVHHAYIDVDNDGKRDLLASAGQLQDKQSVWYYKNTNTDASPVFTLQKTDFLQNEMLETGQGACPVFFDADGDGKLDIVVAHGVYDTSIPGIVSRLSLYKNVGSTSAPAFQLIDEDYATLSNYSLFFPIAATFGDLDGDGDKDMIIGDFAGNIHLFNNSAGAGNPANFTLATPVYMGIDVGNNATPQLVDLDNDGLLDLVIGRQTGTFNYYHNTGTVNTPAFSSTATITPLGQVNLTQNGNFSGYSVPYIFSYGGHHQMLTANMHGDVFYYDNIDNNLNGTFTCIDTVASGEFGVRSSGFNIYVSGGDINHDGYMDMLVGLYSGGVQIYYGSNAPISVGDIAGSENFSCYPNPANNRLSIRSSMAIKKVEIYNMLGELVMNKNQDVRAKNQELPVDISAIESGMYIVVVTDGKLSQHERIFIQH